MELSLTSIFKKKVSEEKVAELFVNITFNSVDSGFEEVTTLLNHDSNLAGPAGISPEDQDHFLLIVITGNLKLLENYFYEGQESRIQELIIEKLAGVYEVDVATMSSAIDKMSAFFGRVNFPSKNTHYAMSKAVFFKYGLNDFQQTFYRKQNVPHPILLKNIDEIMETFIIKWDTFTEKYRITE